jgi:hypothetical protein
MAQIRFANVMREFASQIYSRIYNYGRPLWDTGLIYIDSDWETMEIQEQSKYLTLFEEMYVSILIGERIENRRPLYLTIDNEQQFFEMCCAYVKKFFNECKKQMDSEKKCSYVKTISESEDHMLYVSLDSKLWNTELWEKTSGAKYGRVRTPLHETEMIANKSDIDVQIIETCIAGEKNITFGCRIKDMLLHPRPPQVPNNNRQHLRYYRIATPISPINDSAVVAVQRNI